MPPRSWMPSTSTTLPARTPATRRERAASQPPRKAGGRQPQTAAKDPAVRSCEPPARSSGGSRLAYAVHLCHLDGGQVALSVRQVCPRLGEAGVRDDGTVAGRVPVLLQPRLLRGIPALEHQQTFGSQGLMDCPQRCRPAPGRSRRPRPRSRLWSRDGPAVGADPWHLDAASGRGRRQARPGLAPGDAQGGGGRAGSDDLQATSDKQAGEGSLSRSRCPGRSQR